MPPEIYFPACARSAAGCFETRAKANSAGKRGCRHARQRAFYAPHRGDFCAQGIQHRRGYSSFSAIASAQDQAAVEAGEQLYDDNCQQCHGEKLRNPGTSFDLRKFKADDRPRFNKFVMEGKGQMPAWQGTLSDGDIDAIWAYIRAHAYDK